MLLFLINKSLKPRKNNTLVLILHILTQKLHWKPAGINKDLNLIVEHSNFDDFTQIQSIFVKLSESTFQGISKVRAWSIFTFPIP